MIDVQIPLFVGILSLFILWIAYKKRYFTWEAPSKQPRIPSFLFFGALLGYLILYFLIPLVFGSLVHLPTIGYLAWSNFLTQIFLIFLFILFFFHKWSLMQGIFKNSSSSIFFDLFLGMITWVIAYPFVVFISSFIEGILLGPFHFEELPDQIAVEYFKMALTSPLYGTLAFFSIIFLAPLLEEFMFRGLLQNWLKRWMGRLYAIGITSICFALFHFSFIQGMGNIPIITSLFFLSFFLGFIYERQRSLFASISLHATFNFISLINLLIFKVST